MDLFALAIPNILDGTGSAVTITAIVNAPQGGPTRTLYPVTGTTITNGATFAVDGAADYVTAAGDALEFEAVTTSTYKVHITKKDGAAVVGSSVQRVYNEYLTWGSTATAIPTDDTIPLITEGVEIITVAITPKSTAHKLRITAVVNCSANAVANVNAAIFRDAEVNALAAWTVVIATAGWGEQIILRFEETAPSTSAITYRLRIGPNANTMYINGAHSARQFGGVAKTTLTVEEVS